MYGGSVHTEALPMPREGISGTRADFTDKLVAFNAYVWKRKRDEGLPLNVDLAGVPIPPDLKPFDGDLRRLHRLASGCIPCECLISSWGGQPYWWDPGG